MVKRMVKSFKRKGLTGVVDAFPVYTRSLESQSDFPAKVSIFFYNKNTMHEIA